MKKAIVQCADTGPLESLVVMLRTVGYECFKVGEDIKHTLRSIGCDTVLDIEGLVRHWGYEEPFSMPIAPLKDMQTCDLFVDIKAHRSYHKIVKHWPNLKRRVLWYRINGGEPEHVINARGDHGDEVNPPCPVLTPNQWYADKWFELPPDNPPDFCGADGRAYVCWPPFHRFGEYFDKHGRTDYHNPPLCLIHNVSGWGYQALVPNMQKLGVRIYGVGSPDGMIEHKHIPKMLSNALCMVHLKSNDAPGYSLMEAMAAACPVICTRRLIWRCRMQDLLIPNETCLVFDRETHEGLSEKDVEECTREVKEHLIRIGNPHENQRIGLNGYNKLKEIMWSANFEGDVQSLQSFMNRWFK